MSKHGRYVVEINAEPRGEADSLTQSERFKKVARELGSDEDETAFKAKLSMIARQKPKDEKKPDDA